MEERLFFEYCDFCANKVLGKIRMAAIGGTLCKEKTLTCVKYTPVKEGVSFCSNFECSDEKRSRSS